jgi:predicted nuclease of restriction endonuclease-like (RecB) superfamily
MGNEIKRFNSNLYDAIHQVLETARQSAYKAVNFAMVQAYWQVGRLIVEDEQSGKTRAEYGKKVLEELAARLTADFGKGFTITNLKYMRSFYRAFPIGHALRDELSWTHYRLLLRVENQAARDWYMNEAAAENWSSRQLERQISVLYYDRMLLSADKQSTKTDAEENMALAKLEPENFIRNPYVLEFLNLQDYPNLHEKDIEQGLINNLQTFLLELGKGFCFVARQKRIRFEEKDFYIDLVFYNCILKCYVLIDLKLGELTYQDIGQMDGYIRLYEEQYRKEDDNPTLGIVLCSNRNEAMVKYSVLHESKQLFASKYLLYLPSEDELKKEIERERKLLDAKESENA